MAGDFTTAVPYFKKSLEILPDYAEAWRSLGITYQYLGDSTEARRCLQQAERFGKR
jgi:Flp pilus assembly protein TadD